MALVDELTIHIQAGDGGDGAVRWRHRRGKEFSGPAGGDGGRGGDVYIAGHRDMNLLGRYRHEKKFRAEDGEHGMSESMTGKSGEDLVIDLPVGSIIKNLQTGETYELLSEGEKIKILRGGNGGYGNEHFKGSTNRRPRERTEGKQGEEASFYVELELIADAGFIGLPNAGKTTLLNALSGASSRVGSYEFTTLDPNLGSFYGYILADIPGLIEGASAGKGLGHKFLRHIKRTQVLIHCISLEENDIEKAYLTIRHELESFDESLLEKKEIVVLTKSDEAHQNHIADAKKIIKKYSDTTLITSILDDTSIKHLSDKIVEILQK